MFGRDPQLRLRIVSDSKDAVAGLDRTSSKIGGLVKAGGAALLGAGVAAAAGIYKVTESAGNLEQSIGAIDTVFKGSAKQVHGWAKNAATDVGLTRNEFNELGTLIGSQLKNGGTAMDQLAPKTNKLIGLGADLASMFGGTTREAVESISSALKGERDPIEKYGVSLKQASIDAEAARLGFKKVGGTLSTQATQAATLSLIMKQTADAQGNFNRETDTYAHQKQVFVASVKDAGDALGTRFLPLATKGFKLLNSVGLPAIDGLLGSFDKLTSGTGTKDLTKLLGLDVIMPILKSVKDAFTPLLPVVVSFVRDGILPFVANVRDALAPILTTLAARIMPLVASAIAAILPPLRDAFAAAGRFALALSDVLVPAIEFLWPIVTTIFDAVKKVITSALKVITAIFRTFTALLRGDWAGVWDGIKSIVSTAWTLIKSIIGGALRIIGAVLSTQWTIIKGLTSKAWSAIVGVLSSAWASAKSAVATGAGRVLDYVRGIPGRILSALGNLNNLLRRAGVAILRGFLDGLRQQWESVKNFVGGIGSWIADHKGPISYDRKLLRPAGAAIMSGLRDSLRDGIPELRRVLGEVTRTVEETAIGAPTIDPLAPSSSSAAGRATGVVHITINGAVDTIGTANQIKDVLTRAGYVIGGPR